MFEISRGSIYLCAPERNLANFSLQIQREQITISQKKENITFPSLLKFPPD